MVAPIERKHELRYICPDFYVVERDTTTYLIHNQIWTAIDAPDFQADEHRLSITINGTLHEFPNRNRRLEPPSARTRVR